jgi:ipoprotein LpqH
MKRICYGLIVATSAVVSGCGLTGEEPVEPPAHSGSVTIDGHTRSTQSVACTQNDWLLSIDADAPPGRVRAALQLGGQQPEVQTVSIENIDTLTGVAGGEVGDAKATTDGAFYTITGTAVGSDPANPGESRRMPFEIKAPC